MRRRELVNLDSKPLVSGQLMQCSKIFKRSESRSILPSSSLTILLMYHCLIGKSEGLKSLLLSDRKTSPPPEGSPYQRSTNRRHGRLDILLPLTET
jgi:hypothetical protein